MFLLSSLGVFCGLFVFCVLFCFVLFLLFHFLLLGDATVYTVLQIRDIYLINGLFHFILATVSHIEIITRQLYEMENIYIIVIKCISKIVVCPSFSTYAFIHYISAFFDLAFRPHHLACHLYVLRTGAKQAGEQGGQRTWVPEGTRGPPNQNEPQIIGL